MYKIHVALKVNKRGQGGQQTTYESERIRILCVPLAEIVDNRLHMNLNSSLSSSPIVIYNDGSSEQFTVPIYERYLVIR